MYIHVNDNYKLLFCQSNSHENDMTMNVFEIYANRN